MENNLKNIRIRRFAAFIYDLLFILLLSFTVYMLLGLIFKLDSKVFANVMIFITLAVITIYILFGELFLQNTLGKYLVGLEVTVAGGSARPSWGSMVKRGLLKIIWPVEGIVMLFSKQGRRLGDMWGNTIVVNRKESRLNPASRLSVAAGTIIVLYFCFSILLGLAARRTDFYKAGTAYLTASGQVRITGLPKEVSQSPDTINFGVPVHIENLDRFARIYLGKSDGQWVVYKTEFFNGHLGTSFGYSF